jgi:hypothetical protein
MKPKNHPIRRAALRFFITRKKFGARAWPVRPVYRARAPDKENS